MMAQRQIQNQASMMAWLGMVERLRRAAETVELAGEPLETIQTHISVVLLGRRHALKLKKPVDFGFLDYSTLARRRAACEAEVRLNRRLCPQIYLGVRPVVERAGTLHLSGAGRVLDYAVLMKRLPEARMLDHLLENGEVTAAMLGRVAARLADFHHTARRAPEVNRHGGEAALRRNWDENFEQARPYLGRTISAAQLEAIEKWIVAELEQKRELLRNRVRDGRVCDGHGDARCESVCLLDDTPEGVCFFDCIEFNDRFRCGDVAGEAAFLAMDLDARGRPDLGYLFTEQYAACAGDEEMFALLPFYRCYRAFVRGKVLSFRLDEAEFDDDAKKAAGARARHFFELATRYAARLSTPCVVAVAGLSGSGKSTLARAVAAELGLRVVSSDATRAELFGAGKRPAAYGEGCYSEEAGDLVYQALLERGRERLRAGDGVILDATFASAARRAAARDMAREAGADWRLIVCKAPPPTVRARLEARAARGDSTSDANWSIYRRQRERFETPRGSAEGSRLLLDTRGDVTTIGRAAADWLRACEEAEKL
jgi:aminoglycoside phosphotransferase family enzyme/predicted kinase